MGLYILFFWILFLSSLSLAPKNYFFPVCDQNLFCSEFWGKAFAVLSTCGDYRSIAFTSLHLLLNIGSIFFFFLQRGYTFLQSVLPYVNHIKHVCGRWFSDIWGPIQSQADKYNTEFFEWGAWKFYLMILFPLQSTKRITILIHSCFL